MIVPSTSCTTLPGAVADVRQRSGGPCQVAWHGGRRASRPLMPSSARAVSAGGRESPLVAADRADGDACGRVRNEEARAPVGAAVEHRGGRVSTAESAHGALPASETGCCCSRKHVVTLFLRGRRAEDVMNPWRRSGRCSARTVGVEDRSGSCYSGDAGAQCWCSDRRLSSEISR